MKQLLWYFVQLSLLREKPQSLPDSLWLLKGLALLYVLTGLPVAIRAYGGPETGLAMLAVELVAHGLLLFVILKVRDRANRWRQGFTAWMGVGVLFAFVVYGLQVLSGLGLSPSMRGMLELLLFFWSILVMAHILRHAADIALPFAVLIMLFYAMTLLGLLAQFIVPEAIMQPAASSPESPAA